MVITSGGGGFPQDQQLFSPSIHSWHSEVLPNQRSSFICELIENRLNLFNFIAYKERLSEQLTERLTPLLDTLLFALSIFVAFLLLLIDQFPAFPVH
uniref:Uncharacterized protein n=1 Tax=Octopus bimaculoides TaxID=37653 RepID=A0A0L8G6I4_OCTBM